MCFAIIPPRVLFRVFPRIAICETCWTQLTAIRLGLQVKLNKGVKRVTVTLRLLQNNVRIIPEPLRFRHACLTLARRITSEKKSAPSYSLRQFSNEKAPLPPCCWAALRWE